MSLLNDSWIMKWKLLILIESAWRKFIIELQQRCFLRGMSTGRQVGPLNSLLQHYRIVIATGKCLSSYRKDLPKLGVKPQPKNAKRPLLDDVLLKNVFAEDRTRNYWQWLLRWLHDLLYTSNSLSLPVEEILALLCWESWFILWGIK